MDEIALNTFLTNTNCESMVMIAPPYGFTMVGLTRLENFRAAINEVNRQGIPGDIMELGVWRGVR